jgi:hypothetical protein
MEPQNLKQRPALNIITLPYLLQARVKAQGLKGIAYVYWEVEPCSVCQYRRAYIFQGGMPEAEPRFDAGCHCAHAGSRPATWAEVAQHLLEHGTAADFKWWDIEQPGATPFTDMLLAAQPAERPAGKVLRFTPDPAIDRILIDVATGSATTITVVLSGQFLAYGPAVRQQTFGHEYSADELMASVPDCLQWPAAPPEVVAALERMPTPPPLT